MGRILVVDDEVEACKALEEFLTLKGHEVHTAHDGPTALNKVKALRFHLVLLDMIMPGMHGLKVLNEIKKIDPFVKIVMVTVVNEIKQARQTFNLGAYDYITKPVDFNILENLLTATILEE